MVLHYVKFYKQNIKNIGIEIELSLNIVDPDIVKRDLLYLFLVDTFFLLDLLKLSYISETKCTYLYQPFVSP